MQGGYELHLHPQLCLPPLQPCGAVRATSSYGGKVVVEGTRAAQSTPAMYLIKDGAMPSTSNCE